MVNKILLVDDDAASNFLSREVLNDLDAAEEIVVADDGDIAYNLLSKNNCPDIIFLDIRMPRMSGFDLLNRLAQMEVCKMSKVVLLTSSTRQEDRDKAFQYKNVLDYLEKPLTKGVAQRLMEEHFR